MRGEILRREHLELLGHHFQRVVREGHPTVGWEGDPWMSVYYNKLLRCYEVWDEHDPDRPRLELRSKPDIFPDPTGLAVLLNKSDLRRKDMRTRVKEIHDYNERLQASIDKANQEARTEAMSRVVHALVKDAGHLE